ncbi:MAG: formate--tetrahydrofolate ligase [Alphaproteobacteria bacterium]|nr:formate--tetrahydrofolate ligase [Alphaproteobacteria bacterium]
MSVPSDLDIANAATLRPIAAVAAKAGIPESALYAFGPHKAKLTFDFIASVKDRPDGRLILVTGISPTAAGEGKTTTTIGLADALNRLGRRAMIALREPSLGPCFGVKGGATGGGYAQVAPMAEINLHFTGDFHAITAANNLLAAMIDNHIYWGNALGLDTRRIAWRRAMDMNDRALRQTVSSLGGVANGYAREDGFDITVASEVMAIFCLATDLDDLARRLGDIILGWTREGRAVTARELKAHGAMTALLRDALMPNIAQTLEGNPALIHGGPFANIAHGCNSVVATRLALKLGEYVVTEAGFGADLGAEKFIDIKCRKAGLRPSAAVVVATVRALKMHGGVAKADLKAENIAALKAGIANLARHVENMQGFGLPVVVAINRFVTDTDAEIAAVQEAMAALGAQAVLCTHWADGGRGAEALAQAVMAAAERADPARFRFCYPDEMGLAEKIRTIARSIYRAADVQIPAKVAARLAGFEKAGFGRLPVCIAKTQYSFSADPEARGAPEGHILPVREVRLSAGAGFVVAVCGEIMTMPGLPKVPAAEGIGVNAAGTIEGLF